jgi:chromosome segregation ATPase
MVTSTAGCTSLLWFVFINLVEHSSELDATLESFAKVSVYLLFDVQVAEEAERQRDLRRALEGEAADLRASVSALESTVREMDVRHVAQLADVRRELDAARKEVQQLEAEKGGLLVASVRESEERKRAEGEAAAARLEVVGVMGESEACRERQRETDTCLAEMRWGCL